MTPELEHVLLYDALCPMCLKGVETLRRRGLLENAEPRPLDDAPGLGLPEADVEALRSEMILWSRVSRTSSRGFDAVLRLLEVHGRGRLLRALARVPLFKALGSGLYQLVSRNRRILSPPATGGAACECDPPFRAGWRAALLVSLLAVFAGGTLLQGFSLSIHVRDVPASLSALRALAAAAAGFIVASVAFGVVLPRRFAAFLWQALVAVTIGAAILGLFAVVAFLLAPLGLPSSTCAFWNALALVSSVLSTLLATVRRHRNLGFPGWSPGLWLAAFEGPRIGLVVAWDLLGFRFLFA